jgi:PAS domain S-box-containing protein
MNESERKADAAPPVGNRTVDGTRPDYCSIVDGVPGCILVADSEGQMVHANNFAVATLGRPLEDLLGDGWLKSLDRSLINDAEKMWRRCVQEREPLNAIWRLRQRDGTYRWQHLKATLTADGLSTSVTWYLLAVDVDELCKAQEALILDTTAHENAELALLQSEQQMQSVMDTVPSMVWSMAPDGSVTFINRKVRDYSGMSLDQIRKSGPLEMIHPEEREAAGNECQTALANGSLCEAEHRLRRADGLYRWHLIRAEPMRNENGQIVQWLAVFIDIDDQKRAEERLRKLRANVSDTSRNSLGAEIAASIAHEINQPLTSVLVNAQACARWLNVVPPKVEQAVASVGRIVRDARAVDAVMHNVRLLFKRQPAVKTRCNMVDLIHDAVSLISENVNRRFTPIEYDCEEPVLMVLADRYQIQQVIINLVGNAIEAMQGSSRLPSLCIRILRTADGQVLTEVIDNGCGLPIQNIDNMFDAFVTTKKNGMGIGLSISRSIVEAHGGQLWAENNPDYGAKFSLLLNVPETTAESE